MRDVVEEAWQEIDSATKLTTDQLLSLIGKAGRNAGPDFLACAFQDGKIQDSTVTALIGSVWSNAEFPDRYLERDEWRYLFDVAGYTVDGKPALRPTEPVELWRGSVPERRGDWSWTADRTVAERFANGMRGRLPGRIYRVVAPPEALLCCNTERGEAEYVVDTTGLTIEEVDQ